LTTPALAPKQPKAKTVQRQNSSAPNGRCENVPDPLLHAVSGVGLFKL